MIHSYLTRALGNLVWMDVNIQSNDGLHSASSSNLEGFWLDELPTKNWRLIKHFNDDAKYIYQIISKKGKKLKKKMFVTSYATIFSNKDAESSHVIWWSSSAAGLSQVMSFSFRYDSNDRTDGVFSWL